MVKTRRELNLELGRRANDLSNARDPPFWDLCSAAMVFHAGEQTAGREDLRLGDEQLFAAVPDVRRTLVRQMADHEMLVEHWSYEGTEKATGRPVHWEGCTWMRIEDGLVAEGWVLWDPSQLQLG